MFSGLEPAISILVPAYNEEATIAASVRSMLQLTYSEFEIIVINDGSKDGTLEVLQREFALQPFPEALRAQARRPNRCAASTARRCYPNLRVIDKVNGGKADSLNAGINCPRYPAVLRRRCRLDPAARQPAHVVAPFLRDPRMVATGGTVRVANGCEVSGGFLTSVGLPRNPLGAVPGRGIPARLPVRAPGLVGGQRAC